MRLWHWVHFPPHSTLFPLGTSRILGKSKLMWERPEHGFACPWRRSYSPDTWSSFFQTTSSPSKTTPLEGEQGSRVGRGWKGEVHVTAAACSQTQAVDKVPTSAEVYFFLIPSPRSACLKPVGPPLLPGTFWSWGIFFFCFFPVSRSKGLENLKETSKFHPLISSLSLWSTQNSSYICFFLDWAFPELSDRPQNLSLHTSH